MKFITEEDLRELYKHAPFTTYELEPGARLTPGARQYLVDKGMLSDFDEPFKKSFQKSTPAAEAPMKKRGDARLQLMIGKLKTIESRFFITEKELLPLDVCTVEILFQLRKQLAKLRMSCKDGSLVEDLSCHECTGMNKLNFSELGDDCFEITEFHVQLEKGHTITQLQLLRCELQEFVLECRVLIEEEAIEKTVLEQLIGKVNQVVNSLSQLLCSAYGGKKCQRLG